MYGMLVCLALPNLRHLEVTYVQLSVPDCSSQGIAWIKHRLDTEGSGVRDLTLAKVIHVMPAALEQVMNWTTSRRRSLKLEGLGWMAANPTPSPSLSKIMDALHQARHHRESRNQPRLRHE